MSDMDEFDELPWDIVLEDTVDQKFTRRNPKRYRAVVAKLVPTINKDTGKSSIATITVPTGELIAIGGKRRGKDEHLDAQAFRDAAKEVGLGLRVDYAHIGNGKTDLRIQLQPKKEFTAEAIESRKVKLAASRAKKEAEKAAAAKAAAPSAPAPVQGAAKKASQ